MAILVNIDVPDLGAGIAFYIRAFGRPFVRGGPIPRPVNFAQAHWRER